VLGAVGSLSSYVTGGLCDKYENYSLGFTAYISTVVTLVIALIASFIKSAGFIVFLSVCLGIVNACFASIVLILILRESGNNIEIIGIYFFANGIGSNVYNIAHTLLNRNDDDLWIIILVLIVA
jgi:hypothetical protein